MLKSPKRGIWRFYLKNCAVKAAKSNYLCSRCVESTFEGFAPKGAAWKTELFCIRYFSKMCKSTKTIMQ